MMVEYSDRQNAKLALILVFPAASICVTLLVGIVLGRLMFGIIMGTYWLLGQQRTSTSYDRSDSKLSPFGFRRR